MAAPPFSAPTQAELVSGLNQGRPFTLSCFTPAHCSRAPTPPAAWVSFFLHRGSHRWVPHRVTWEGVRDARSQAPPAPAGSELKAEPVLWGFLRIRGFEKGAPAQVVPAARWGPAGIPERSLWVGARSGLCITRADRCDVCPRFPGGQRRSPSLGGPACPPAPWTGAGRGGRQSQVPAASAGTPLPAAPAPTFTRVAQQDGFRAAFCLPRSPERQPHAASSVSQAFKLPFYLNLCPRIQAEKGPFQSQFLFYGFMGDRMGQLPPVPRCSQHRGGSRGSGCSRRNPVSQLRGSR